MKKLKPITNAPICNNVTLPNLCIKIKPKNPPSNPNKLIINP